MFAFFVLLASTTACNNYPLQLLEAKPYAEITDSFQLENQKKIDILFVIDSSGSMKEEQDKLARNFEQFINLLLSKKIEDIQIGIISTGNDTNEKNKQPDLGKLEGDIKILSSKQLNAAQLKDNFIKTVVSVSKQTGSNFEKPLEAMRRALSPSMQSGPNKGFLRANAQLAVIFVTDEDDCSHNGNIKENDLVHPLVCSFPNDQIVTDRDGTEISGNDGKPLKGQMNALIPVSEYITFLNGLKRKVTVAGLIGSPFVNKPNQPQTLIDPAGGCNQHIECSPAGAKHFCAWGNDSQRKCGGCSSTKLRPDGTPENVADPSFRLYELIKAFPVQGQSWFPICGDDEGFRNALINFADSISRGFDSVVLTRHPHSKETVTVRIVYPDQRQPQVVPMSQTTGACGASCTSSCIDKQCWSDGWHSEINGSNQFVIRLIGKSQQDATPGTTIEITYPIKQTAPTSTTQPQQ